MNEKSVSVNKMVIKPDKAKLRSRRNFSMEKKIDALISYVSNVVAKTEKEYKDLANRFEKVEDALKDIVEIEQNRRVYTSEELADMKKNMSWQSLAKRTGIPISTLQYRVRKYKQKMLEDETV